MFYNGAAEYWFYHCLDNGPSLRIKQNLASGKSFAFIESYRMYEWATLFYLENLAYEAKVAREAADKNIIGGKDEQNDQRLCYKVGKRVSTKARTDIVH